MSGTRNGSRSRGPGEGPGGRRVFSYREAAIGLVSAAVFVALFYLFGAELSPRPGARAGAMFPLAGAIALTLAVTLFLVEWFGFAGREVRKVRLAARDFLFLFSVALLLLFVAKGIVEILSDVQSWRGRIPARVFAYLIPLPAAGVVVRVLLNSEVALLFTAAASVLSAAAASGRWSSLLFLLLAGTAGAARSGRIPDRYGMLKAGVLAAPVCAAGAYALEVAFHGTRAAGWAALFGAFSGLSAGPIGLALLPLAEYAFGYASDIRLGEMANVTHPLLARLMAEAPGTFHHSVLVGTLAEAGALAIGANPMLCRVAALFHDVGKVIKPEYYSENQRGGGNPHDMLSPGMSRTVIVSHVREGVRLAGEYRLGDRIAEIIGQHHGTSLLYCFLDKAQPDILERKVTEETFRYPGPRPRSREAAIIMLADAAEAAAHSLRDPTPAEIEEAVTRVVNRAYLDGQLDECDMTLRDLHTVGEAFSRVLSAVSRGRVDYPERGRGPLRLIR